MLCEENEVLRLECTVVPRRDLQTLTDTLNHQDFSTLRQPSPREQHGLPCRRSPGDPMTTERPHCYLCMDETGEPCEPNNMTHHETEPLPS